VTKLAEDRAEQLKRDSDKIARELDNRLHSPYVFFISDVSGVCDELKFPSNSAAQVALGRNGFKRFAASAYLQPFMRPPSPPYHWAVHPNGPIYSSGRFWRSRGKSVCQPALVEREVDSHFFLSRFGARLFIASAIASPIKAMRFNLAPNGRVYSG
jgi:hypothetical protein